MFALPIIGVFMRNEIPKEELFEHAKISTTIDAIGRLPGTESWLNATISKLPIKIFDINGELLFYDYPIQSAAKGEGIQGYVTVGSRKNIGSPVISYELGPRRWNFNQAVEKLKPLFKKKFPKHKVTDIKLVCYSFPKLGVMFQAINQRGAASRHIFDGASLAPVPERKEKTEIEGFFAWSYLESLTDAMKKARLRQYNQVNKKLRRIPEIERTAMLKAKVFKQYLKSDYVGTIVKFGATKLLQYCTHYNYSETRSHHCFVLQGQQVNDYCAVATCQMILCYYRYYYTQDQIAPALNYSSGGGCPPDQSIGYEQLTCNHLDATFDSSPTFSEAKDQIDALHPFKSGVPSHARACAGYYRNLLTGVNRLYIYDPSPWNANYKLAGSIKWEDWNAITHTNYVFTKLTCP
jgi:hypothetical protein